MTQGAPEALPEAAARTVLAQWLAAQNQGDMAAYERLYAGRFEGIRRTGPVTRRMDRAGWMRERQGMFATAQQVTADGVTVRGTPGEVVVRFTQTWSSGTFRDAGPKVLVLVPQGPELRIAREELLRSDVDTTAAEAVPLAPGSFMLTLPEAPTYVVLSYAPEETWANGPPALVSQQTPVTTRKSVDGARIPPSLAALVGRAVRLYGPTGAVVCTGTLGSPAVVHRVDPHFGTRQRWAGTFEAVHTHPWSAAAIARDAWDESERGALLTATVDAPAGQCAGARWARLSDLPALTVYVKSPADPMSAALALARFRALPGWERLQRAYDADPDAHHGARWDEHARGQPEAWVWRAVLPVGSPRTFVTVNGAAAVGGCGSFLGDLWGMFELAGGEAVLRTDRDESEWFYPDAAVDVDGDGVPELIGVQGLVRRVGTVHRLVESLGFSSHDCAC